MLELGEALHDGDVEITARRETSSFDYRTIETKVETEARGAAEITYTLHLRLGSRAKQNRLRIKAGQ